MKDRWSSAICDRYQLHLSEELREWLDGDWNAFHSTSEFSHYASLSTLPDAAPQNLWPGFMLPDTLPIVGNRFGDWLCMRINEQGGVSEIVHWYHGGGDFLPFGITLAEALFYDQCQSSRPDHATWGEVVPREDGKPSILLWIASRLGVSVALLEEIVASFRAGQVSDGLEAIKSFGWCQAAVARDGIDLALSTPLRVQADPKLATRLGVSWEQEMTSWLFDTSLIPNEYHSKLQEMLGADNPTWLHQNWDEAERIAVEAMNQRSDLAWAFDIAGWGAYRRGETSVANERWLKGLRASLFSDQSTRLRSHWFDNRMGKFSAAQLARNVVDSASADFKDPYWMTLLNHEAGGIHSRVTAYWMKLAAGSSIDPKERYDLWYRAGWDVGCHEVPLFESILHGLEESATQAGWQSRASIAAAYRARLRRR